jgi:glycosyltransferase involved in cell wall biosynthesis
MPISANPIRISVIVPVYNNAPELRECLSALMASSFSGSEIIVVDDASTDDSPEVGAQMGVPVLRLERNSGPSAARNYGARHARGDIIFFVDADVVVMRGAVSRVVKIFNEHPEIDGVFGSYDLEPRVKTVISQYRNLLHHYVHQKGNPNASTFWAGCGAIRRAAFEKIGGFDDRWPAIEDIELGYRLRQAHYRVLLDKELHGTHLKNWTFRSMIRTDVFSRAIPWAHLIMQRKFAPNDLNLQWRQRLSGIMVLLTLPLLGLAVFGVEWLLVPALCCVVAIALNRDLYIFFWRQRGLYFAVMCIPLHLLYYLYSGLSFLFVWFNCRFRRLIAIGQS